MAAPSLSIVIPTHKRASILRTCLERIDAQTVRGQLEVIVVSDGPDRASAELMKPLINTEEELVKRGGEPTYHYLEIPKSQQGVARNRGVERATAPLILFIGDDIFLKPDACAKHLETHALFNKRTKAQEAVLGFTTWDPELNITPVMRYLETSGWQFGYPLIEQYAGAALPVSIQHKFTYTSHISLPTAIAKQHPFREDVRLYGWEDVEWGLRLAQAGVPLVYQPEAVAFHHHPLTLAQSLKRMETLGTSAVHIQQVAGLRVTPRGWKALVYRVIALLPTMRGRHAQAFLLGIARASHASA